MRGKSYFPVDHSGDLCFFFMELYKTFVKNGCVEGERRELIHLRLFIKIFYYGLLKKMFYAKEYFLKKNVEKYFVKASC